MPHVFHHTDSSRLDAPERKEMLPADKILSMTGLAAGATMADVGAGTGFFAIPAARIVGGEGRVLAADISIEMLDIIRSKLTRENEQVITLIQSSKDSCGIPDEAADFLLLSTVLHETADPLTTIRDLYRAVKPGGKCVIIEWRKEQADKGPPIGDRLAEDEVRRMLLEAGFDSVTAVPLNQWFYILAAVKRHG